MDRNSMTILTIVTVCLGLLLTSGCGSGGQAGSAIGALAGAGIGQMAGHDTESTLIGAAVGGAAGYMLGNENDKKKAQQQTDQIREEMNYVTVNITNSNGSVSQVRLRKHGIGYVGTRGEFYDHLPSEDELRPIYGF